MSKRNHVRPSIDERQTFFDFCEATVHASVISKRRYANLIGCGPVPKEGGLAAITQERPALQYHLPYWPGMGSGQIITLVSTKRHSLLDRHVCALVDLDEILAPLVRGLAKRGKCRWGDLVQLDELAVLGLIQWNGEVLVRLLALLGKYDLTLNMRTRGWRSSGGIMGGAW